MDCEFHIHVARIQLKCSLIMFITIFQYQGLRNSNRKESLNFLKVIKIQNYMDMEKISFFSVFHFSVFER